MICKEILFNILRNFEIKHIEMFRDKENMSRVYMIIFSDRIYRVSINLKEGVKYFNMSDIDSIKQKIIDLPIRNMLIEAIE